MLRGAARNRPLPIGRSVAIQPSPTVQQQPLKTSRWSPRVAEVRTPTELVGEFRARGLKVTPQRVAVFAALEGNDQHPSAEAVFAIVREEMPTISLRTVYQTLNDLAAMGEIGQLELGTGAARFDPNTGPHHHLVCDRCGLVRDVPVGAGEPTPPRSELAGFRVHHTEVVFRGRCAPCAAATD